MEQVTLEASRRDLLGKKVKNLRENGQLPAILYGKKTKALPLSLDKNDFSKIAKEAGEATLIDLRVKGNPSTKVLIRDIQKHPVSDETVHVDLYQVDMTEEIQTEIPIKFEGVSAAVEELEGNFVPAKDSVKVECLPDKLVSELIVDISNLKTFEDLIHIKDLKVPLGIKVLDEGEEIVAQVTPPRSEEELEAMEEETKTAAETEKAQIAGMEAEVEAEKAAKVEGEGEVETETTQAVPPQEKEKS